ncbi:hypothetical protein [Calothrix rhizosoleniae]|uniref:hypothetical protein n=1 Tax=Calothrix rhizosoleniae TaxID=888997 RepID=UPI000B49C0BB|nr:hypothetical protein [Calothrix rhizosoleniae]
MRNHTSSNINQPVQKTVPNYTSLKSKLALWSALDDESSQSVVGGMKKIEAAIKPFKIVDFSAELATLPR